MTRASNTPYFATDNGIPEAGRAAELPLLEWVEFDRDKAASRWEFIDDCWKLESIDHRVLMRIVRHPGTYQPRFRSPTHIAVLRDHVVSDFQLDVRVKSTQADYGHRDVCVFFGFQNPDHFYYAHLAKQTDDHANQIFIVNNADRTKISQKTSTGTAWDDRWHWIRIVREVESGTISVYFDNRETPVMSASDITFVEGRVGVGSFDDTADFSEFILKGTAGEDN